MLFIDFNFLSHNVGKMTYVRCDFSFDIILTLRIESEIQHTLA